MGLIKSFLLWRSKRKVSQLQSGDLFRYKKGSEEVWGVFKEITRELISYYNFEKNQTDFFTIERGKGSFYLINSKDNICKDWFEDRNTDDYLIHPLDHVRVWAKKEFTPN